MQGIFKVVYNPVFVAAELNTRAQKLSKNYEVEASDGYYTIYDSKIPIYDSTNPKDIQLQLDRIRLVRSFARK